MAQSISIVEPVRYAIDTTKRLLFSPFDIVKWLAVGFTAWLAFLGEGGSALGNFGFPGNHSDAADPFQGAWDWAAAHIALVVMIATCVGVFIVVLSLVLSWVKSRGKFMFLDNVIRNRAEIVEPWARTRVQGNSYFLFTICLGLAALAILVLIIAIGALIAAPDITGKSFGAHSVIAIVLGSLLFLLYLVALACVSIFLEDFIVPIMALRRCRALAAWNEFFALFKAHTGTFILYLLFKIVLGLAVGVVGSVVSCCLCCIMIIPYIGAVILLPLSVFLRCYSLHFLEQFGARYRVFSPESQDYLSIPSPASA